VVRVVEALAQTPAVAVAAQVAISHSHLNHFRSEQATQLPLAQVAQVVAADQMEQTDRTPYSIRLHPPAAAAAQKAFLAK
jgi:hypothetical protein